jgi:hypothetical protein
MLITDLTTYAHQWSHDTCSSLIPQHMLINDLTTYAHHWSHNICSSLISQHILITGLSKYAHHWSISQHMLIAGLTKYASLISTTYASLISTTNASLISRHMLISDLSTYAHLWSHNTYSSLVSQHRLITGLSIYAHLWSIAQHMHPRRLCHSTIHSSPLKKGQPCGTTPHCPPWQHIDSTLTLAAAFPHWQKFDNCSSISLLGSCNYTVHFAHIEQPEGRPWYGRPL